MLTQSEFRLCLRVACINKIKSDIGPSRSLDSRTQLLTGGIPLPHNHCISTANSAKRTHMLFIYDVIASILWAVAMICAGISVFLVLHPPLLASGPRERDPGSSQHPTRQAVLQYDGSDRATASREGSVHILGPPEQTRSHGSRRNVLGVIIGCNTYESQSDLSGCIPDAVMFAHILRCMGGSLVVDSKGDQKLSHLGVIGNASKLDMQDAISFAVDQAEKFDAICLLFAGHGTLGFIQLTDGTAVPVQDVLDVLERGFHGKQKVVLLDSCRSADAGAADPVKPHPNTTIGYGCMPYSVSGEVEDGGYWSQLVASYWATAFAQRADVSIDEVVQMATVTHKTHVVRALRSACGREADESAGQDAAMTLDTTASEKAGGWTEAASGAGASSPDSREDHSESLTSAEGEVRWAPPECQRLVAQYRTGCVMRAPDAIKALGVMFSMSRGTQKPACLVVGAQIRLWDADPESTGKAAFYQTQTGPVVKLHSSKVVSIPSEMQVAGSEAQGGGGSADPSGTESTLDLQRDHKAIDYVLQHQVASKLQRILGTRSIVFVERVGLEFQIEARSLVGFKPS